MLFSPSEGLSAARSRSPSHRFNARPFPRPPGTEQPYVGFFVRCRARPSSGRASTPGPDSPSDLAVIVARALFFVLEAPFLTAPCQIMSMDFPDIRPIFDGFRAFFPVALFRPLLGIEIYGSAPVQTTSLILSFSRFRP